MRMIATNHCFNISLNVLIIIGDLYTGTDMIKLLKIGMVEILAQCLVSIINHKAIFWYHSSHLCSVMICRMQ